MGAIQTKIISAYAGWTALSALRSGAPLKSRKDIYPLLDRVAFNQVLDERLGPITEVEFSAWHRREVLRLAGHKPALGVGWSAKLINVYLKTTSYVGPLGRTGLKALLHPPIDGGLWRGLRAHFRDQSKILTKILRVRRIRDIRTYRTYEGVIADCADAAKELRCLLIEVEQLWDRSFPSRPNSALERPAPSARERRR
jgi:hypothetical protein